MSIEDVNDRRTSRGGARMKPACWGHWRRSALDVTAVGYAGPPSGAGITEGPPNGGLVIALRRCGSCLVAARGVTPLVMRLISTTSSGSTSDLPFTQSETVSSGRSIARAMAACPLTLAQATAMAWLMRRFSVGVAI